MVIMILKGTLFMIVLLSSVSSEEDGDSCKASYTRSGNLTITYDKVCDPFRLDWAYPMLDGEGTGLTIYHKWKNSASEFRICLQNDGYILGITAKYEGSDGAWHEADFGTEEGDKGTCISSINSEIKLYLQSSDHAYMSMIFWTVNTTSKEDTDHCKDSHVSSGNMTIMYDKACDPFLLEWHYPMLDGEGTGLTIYHKWKNSASEFRICLMNERHLFGITAKYEGSDGAWHAADFGTEEGTKGTCISSTNSEIKLYLQSSQQLYMSVVHWTVNEMSIDDDTNDCKDVHWKSGNKTIYYEKTCDPFRLEWHYPMLDGEGTGLTIYHKWKNSASEFRICLINDGYTQPAARYKDQNEVWHEADFGEKRGDKGTCINSVNSEITLYIQVSENLYMTYVSWTVEQIDPEDDRIDCEDVHWTSGNMTIMYDRLCDPFRLDWHYPMLDGEGTGLTIYHKWKDSASEFRICLLNEGFIGGALASYDDPYEYGVQQQANFGQQTGDVGTCIMSSNSEITLHLKATENVYMFMVHWTVFPEEEFSGCVGQHYANFLQVIFVTLVILAME